MLEDYNAIHQKLVYNNLEYERAKNELDVLQKEELRKKDLKNEENAAKEKIDINESVLKLEQSTLKK